MLLNLVEVSGLVCCLENSELGLEVPNRYGGLVSLRLLET